MPDEQKQPAPSKPLPPKQRAFALNYIADPKRNGKQAAIAAGYSAKTAESQASRMLRNVNVKAFIDEELNRIANKLKIDAEYVIMRLHQLESVDLKLILNSDGSVKPVSDWPEDYGRRIQGYKVTEEEQYSLFGEKDEQGKPKRSYNYEVKIPERISALIQLGRHFGVFKDRLEITNGDLASKLARARSRVQRGA